MAQVSEDEYEAEKKRVTRYHNLLEIPVSLSSFLSVSLLQR